MVINFISYSIYAVLSKYNNFLIEGLIYLNFFIYYILSKKLPNEKFSLIISINLKEFLTFAAITVILVFLLFYEFQVPIFADEIAPTRRAVRTALFGSIIFLDNINLEKLNYFPLKNLIHIFLLVQLLFVSLFIFLLSKKNNIFTLLLIIILTLIFRFFLKDGVHHPPLNHLSTNILTSIFGLSHLTVRISYFLPFIVFLFLVYKKLNEYFDFKTSISFVLCIGTFPLLLLSSITPDHTLWSSMLIIYLLIHIYLDQKINYKLLIYVISIAILFRITSFITFALILFIFIFDHYKNKKNLFTKSYYIIFTEKTLFYPLIAIPIFLTSITVPQAFEGIQETNILTYFISALKLKIPFFALLKQIPQWYYPFFFLIFFINKKVIFLSFFICCLIVWYSIDPSLWGNTKYVVEYGIPFFILGHLICNKYLFFKKKNYIIFIINFSIILLNSYDVYKFPSSRLPSDALEAKGYKEIFRSKDKNSKYLLKIPYPYDDAIDFIKQKKAEKNTLLMGTTYGFLPEIMEGYNYENLKYVKNIQNNYKLFKQKNSSLSPAEKFAKLNEIDNLKYLIIADYPERKNIKKILPKNNWKLVKTFEEKNYKSTLLVYKKKN